VRSIGVRVWTKCNPIGPQAVAALILKIRYWQYPPVDSL